MQTLGLGLSEPCISVWRTLVADGSPVAVMYDVVHPGISLPGVDALRAEVEQGRMVLDVLIDIGVPVTYARTRVMLDCAVLAASGPTSLAWRVGALATRSASSRS